MNFDDYKRVMGDIEVPEGLNDRTVAHVVRRKEAAVLPEACGRVVPSGGTPRGSKRRALSGWLRLAGIGVCAAAALACLVIAPGLWEDVSRQSSPPPVPASCGTPDDADGLFPIEVQEGPSASVSMLGLSVEGEEVVATFEMTLSLPEAIECESGIDLSFGSPEVLVGELVSGGGEEYGESVHIVPVSGTVLLTVRLSMDSVFLSSRGLMGLLASPDDYAAAEETALEVLAGSVIEVRGRETYCYKLSEPVAGNQPLVRIDPDEAV